MHCLPSRSEAYRECDYFFIYMLARLCNWPSLIERVSILGFVWQRRRFANRLGSASTGISSILFASARQLRYNGHCLPSHRSDQIVHHIRGRRTVSMELQSKFIKRRASEKDRRRQYKSMVVRRSYKEQDYCKCNPLCQL